MLYKLPIDEVVKETETNLATGLSTEEVGKRREQFGENVFTEHERPTIISLLFEQINTPLIYILIVAAAISLIVGEISDAIIIFLVITLNAVIGVVQETKAEKALEELKKIASPKAIVKRKGTIYEVPSSELVPGDIVIIETGRYIPADLRLFESVNLMIEESSLTGESVPVTKDANWITDGGAALGEQKNSAFMSTVATAGRGSGIVVKTGMDTEIGKIAQLLATEQKELTPLQRKLAQLSKLLGVGTIIICALIFFIGFFQGREPLDIFLIAISLAVAAIPEGLPAIVTIVLALGVQKMIDQNAIIRKLPAVETLGAVSVICSDKTGTLTQNKMTVTKIAINDKITSTDNFKNNNDTTKRFVQALTLCNDATVNGEDTTGDPTEIALLNFSNRIGINTEKLQEQLQRIYEVPFDSERKMMTTVHSYGDKYYVFVKGAYEAIISKCHFIEINSEQQKLSENNSAKVTEHVTAMSNDALRVLAIAYKVIERTMDFSQVEEGLTFLGLTGIIDPPREEVKAAITNCKQAGIETIMITGDHRETALAIAQQLNIAETEHETMTGIELNELDEQYLKDVVKNIRVFARVSPEHKVKIVNAIKQSNKIVAMTGDGVNDAPSLKRADVGVAMGITGTDVAKGAADIVLTDDNFTTITKAVEQGRNVYNNIKKSILFLLSCNLGEIFALFIGILLGWPAPLTAVQILWVNLITDTLPAISLGIDSNDPDVMSAKPRHPDESIFTKRATIFTILNGLLIGIITLIAFLYGLQLGSNSSSILTIDFKNLQRETIILAQTLAFSALSISQLFHSLNLRHEDKSIFKVGLFTNKYLIASILIGIIIQVSIVTVPTFNNWFHIAQLSTSNWAFVFAISLTPLIINELVKLVKKLFNNN